METLLKNSNGYCDKNSTALSFTDAQRNFLKGQAAMHPNLGIGWELPWTRKTPTWRS